MRNRNSAYRSERCRRRSTAGRCPCPRPPIKPVDSREQRIRSPTIIKLDSNELPPYLCAIGFLAINQARFWRVPIWAPPPSAPWETREKRVSKGAFRGFPKVLSGIAPIIGDSPLSRLTLLQLIARKPLQTRFPEQSLDLTACENRRNRKD